MEPAERKPENQGTAKGADFNSGVLGLNQGPGIYLREVTRVSGKILVRRC